MATSHDTSRVNVALRINYAPTKETLDDNGPGGREGGEGITTGIAFGFSQHAWKPETQVR